MSEGFDDLHSSFILEGDWLTEFQIGTSRPRINVLAKLQVLHSIQQVVTVYLLPFNQRILVNFEELEPIKPILLLEVLLWLLLESMFQKLKAPSPC